MTRLRTTARITLIALLTAVLGGLDLAPVQTASAETGQHIYMRDAV